MLPVAGCTKAPRPGCWETSEGSSPCRSRAPWGSSIVLSTGKTLHSCDNGVPHGNSPFMRDERRSVRPAAHLHPPLGPRGPRHDKGHAACACDPVCPGEKPGRSLGDGFVSRPSAHVAPPPPHPNVPAPPGAGAVERHQGPTSEWPTSPCNPLLPPLCPSSWTS